MSEMRSISPIERFVRETSGGYDSFMFGMSHSFGGYMEEFSKNRMYKFSAPSMDLYYHYMVLQYLCEIYDMSKVKEVVFELPYYIFNYDISKCKKTFQLRKDYYAFFGDYHNTSEICENPTFEMRKGIVWKNNSLKILLRKYYRRLRRSVCYKTESVWEKEKIEKIASLRPHVWYREYNDTIHENEKIWKCILDLLEKYNLTVTVLVFPFCKYFIEANNERVQSMKQLFMKNMQYKDIRYFDFFDMYADRPGLFEDECHLNYKGAYIFSREVSKRI